jgi:serine/threonine protein phosphatase 1
MSLWRRLAGRGAGPAAAAAPGAAGALTRLSLPQMPAATYAVGDPHGCLSLYRQLETAICADGAAIGGTKLIVILGDVVDRGPDTAGLIDHLLTPAPAGFRRVVLRGNHEDMMLRFLAAPGANRSWLDFGGLETLASYGVMPTAAEALSPGPLRQRLLAVMPEAHRAFLETLPVSLSMGEFFLAHAGLNPARPPQDQDPADLMWSDPAQIDAAADALPAGLTVVHGHVVVEQAQRLARRIAVDTGAHQTGRLSAVRLMPAGPALFLVAGSG